jgi:hypothetical protein
MVGVKTTLDLPDELLIAAKKRAAEERTSLRALVARSLRRELGEADGSERVVEIDWDSITVEGGLPTEVDFDNREAMWKWFEAQDR